MSDSIENLYTTILTSFENGYKPSKASIETAKNNSLDAGSLNALKTLYPWHPSFQKVDEQNSTEMLAIDFQYETNDTNRGVQAQKMSPRNGTVVTGGFSSSSTIIIIIIIIFPPNFQCFTNSYCSYLGLEWMIASQQAESKLEGARVDTQREMDSLVKRAKRLAIDQKISYVEAFLRIQQVIYPLLFI